MQLAKPDGRNALTTDLIANRYKLVRTLGEGTMGMVSLCQDTTEGQEVALKVIGSKVGATDKTILQFKQEFRLMTQLRHPHCCQVFDYGVTPAGEPYFTMEVVPGQGLDELPKPVAADEVKRVLTPLLQALGYLHNLGYVHRDIKAANVRVTPDGTVKLMDFGLMDYAGRAGAPISGTPAYMAPEVIKRGPIDQRSDLYAVGCLAYEMLTGRLPFGGELGTLQAMQVLKAHMTDTARPPHELNTAVPSDLSRVVMRLLAKEPLERFRSADEVLEALGVAKGPGAGGNLLASPLMGREAEMALLAERVGELAAGEPGGAILLYGPSGMGKSRLIEEFRFAVQLEGLHYGVGNLHEQGNTPYGPFVRALKALLPAFQAAVPEELAKHGPVLVKLLPGLPFEPAADIDPPSKEKLRLQSTLVELLTALARKRPTAIVLEDWQWADPLSVEFLSFLVRNTRDEALMLVLTARPSDGDDTRLPEGFRRVLVGPLPEHGVKRMVGSMLGTADVDAGFVEKVASFSEGNPYHIKELLDHLVAESTLVLEAGGWNTRVELTAERLPVNLKSLLMRKFTYLSPRAQEVAKAGAVIGRSFDLDLLVDVTGLGDEDLFAAVEMLNLNLVFKVEEDTRYAFAQDQLQQMLYDYMQPEERKRLHASVARALEKRLGATPLSEVPLEQITPVAHHYMQAEVAEKIVAVALHAGASAARLFANVDAKRFLTAGLEHLRALDTGHLTAERFAYLRALGDVLRMLGEMEAAVPLYDEALVLAEGLKIPRGQVAYMMTSLGKCHQILSDLEKALSWCAKSLDICEELGDHVGAARSLLTTCRIHYLQGNKAEMFDHTERGLQKAKEAGDAFRIGEALAFLGYIYITSAPDKVDQGIAHLHESVQILDRLGDKIGLQNCYNLLGNAQNIQGDFMAARTTFELNQKICYEVGMRDDEIICYLNLAQCGLEMGDFEEAAGAAQSAYAYALMNQNKFYIGLALILEATAKSYLGEYKGAIALFERALALALEAKNKYVESLVMQYKVETYLVLGHLGEAKTAAKRLIALIQETGDTSPESRMKAFLGEIVARQGDLAGGREYIQLATSAAMVARAKGIQARALKVDAWISLQAGEWAEAKELALQAMDVARAIGAKYLLAELEGILGEIALATRASDPTEHWERMEDMARAMKSDLLLGQALFGQAATLGNPMRAVPLVKQAQDLLKGLMANLDDDSRICFANLRERNRILEGDFINGYKPKARDINIKVSLPGIKLGQNVWGLS